MRQVTQNYKTGEIKLTDVSPPSLRSGGVLVRTAFSVVSVGTEGMKVREGKMSMLDKARARPDQVKKVLASVQQQGLAATYRKVSNKLDSLTSLGYSASGVIEEVGREATEFCAGQRVACAGAGYANHAETNFVPRNLVVAVPDSVSLEHAAFTTLGAIAMHSVRQTASSLGESVCVIGLGLLGQLTVQLLKAAGCTVIGLDLNAARCDLALRLGADAAGLPDDPQTQTHVRRLTRGAGVDAAIIAAGSDSNKPVETAVELIRDRGRIVSLGKTKLDLPWKDFFERELDVRFSRSYGPGRYDPTYEERGIDYPIGYVRWTERRNMEAFLNLVATGHVQLDPIVSTIRDFSEAESVYDSLASGSSDSLGILLRYERVLEQRPAPAITAAQRSFPKKATLRVGVIGAGNYASSMLLPHLATDGRVRLTEVVTSSGLSSANAIRKFKFDRATTDLEGLLTAADIDAIVVATRHATHSSITARGLRSQKAVFVEKPLAIDVDGLTEVRRAIKESGNTRIQVGFNRRFAPLVRELRAHFNGPPAPLVINYRVHAGQIEKNSWYGDPLEGSRFVGEAGHFFDLMAFLTNARPKSVVAKRVAASTGDDLENLAVVVAYDDGSVGNLLYLTQGSAKVPKEWIEVFGGGKTAQLENFERLTLFSGTSRPKLKRRRMDKGQNQQMKEFVLAVSQGRPMPIDVQSLLDTTGLTLAADLSVRTDASVNINSMFGQA